MNELDPVLTKLDSDNKDILLAGDLNINLLKNNERELFADFLEKLTNHSFYPKMTLPTRFSTHSCSLIDNVFVNSLRILLIQQRELYLPIFQITYLIF